MRLKTILQKLLYNCQTKMHGAYINFLNVAVSAVLDGANLTSASIVRNIKSKTSDKHAIKRVDGMLGNSNLYQSRELIVKS